MTEYTYEPLDLSPEEWKSLADKIQEIASFLPVDEDTHHWQRPTISRGALLPTSLDNVWKAIRDLQQDVKQIHEELSVISLQLLRHREYNGQNGYLVFGRLASRSLQHIEPVWNNKALCLELDHINGDSGDNRQENLRFLCPNCHSQTITYCGRNKKE